MTFAINDSRIFGEQILDDLKKLRFAINLHDCILDSLSMDVFFLIFCPYDH